MTARTQPPLAVFCSVHGAQPLVCEACTSEHAIEHAYQGRRPEQVVGSQVVIAYLTFVFVGALFGAGLTLAIQAVTK